LEGLYKPSNGSYISEQMQFLVVSSCLYQHDMIDLYNDIVQNQETHWRMGCRVSLPGFQGCLPLASPERVQGLPAGVSGVSPDSPFPRSPPAAASKKRKKGFSGTPRTPAKGGCPLQSRLTIVKLTPKRLPVDIDDDASNLTEEVGSDELLSDDNLRLPESANILVRLHAVRAWLERRREEAIIEVGEAALEFQQASAPGPQETRLSRRERLGHEARLLDTQRGLAVAQQRLQAYEDAQALLEDCVAHTTSGERVLVEYYLTLEELVQNSIQTGEEERTPWLRALADVQHRIERVGAPNEED
jgi:hypothetical protein